MDRPLDIITRLMDHMVPSHNDIIKFKFTFHNDIILKIPLRIIHGYVHFFLIYLINRKLNFKF